MESVKEGVVLRILPPEERDAEVARLTNPWIGDEGPLDAGFRRGLGESSCGLAEWPSIIAPPWSGTKREPRPFGPDRWIRRW